jgi:predicted chitinase
LDIFLIINTNRRNYLYGKNMANENPDFSELNDEIRKLRENFATLGQSVSSTNQSMAQAAGNTSKAAQDAANAQRNATKADDDYSKNKKVLMQKMQEFGSAVHNSAMSTENNMSKYSNALTNAGDAVGAFVGQFGVWGKALEYGIKAFTMAADAVMKQNDAILKSYDGLGKFGATVGMTTTDVLNLGIKAGFSSKNLESLYKPAKELGSQLVALGGSSSGGIKAFAEIANIGETARQNFRALGYSQEEVTEMQADYIKEIGRVGGTLAKTPRQLSEESQKYVLQLTALAEITGKSVKEQKQARDLAMANRNLNAYMADLAGREAKAREAGNTAEADRLKKQQENTKAVAAHIQATEDSEVALAKIQSMATDGAVVYDKNNSILLQNRFGMDKLNQSLRAGENPLKTLAINANENQKVADRATKTFGKALYNLGDASGGIQKFTMQSNEARAALATNKKLEEKYMSLSAEERKKIDKMTLEEATKALSADKAAQDGRLEVDNARQDAEREYRKAMDELTAMLSKFVNPALTVLFKTLGVVSKVFLGIVELFSTFGDMIDSVIEGFKGILFWFRDNPITRKVLGLKEVSAEEKKAFEEEKAARQKAIKDRQERRFAKEPVKEEAKPAVPAAAPAKPAPSVPPPTAPAPGAPPPTAPVPGAPPAKPPAVPPTAPPVAPGKPPEAKQDVKENLASITESLKKRGITDQNYINAVIGNVMKESGGKVVGENLNYGKTSNERIRSIFGERASKFTDVELDKIKKDPQQMAEMMYGGETKIGKGMGNTEPGDGWKFRGRGYIQLTGKNNYAAASKAIFNDDRLVKDPDLVNDPKIASDVVAWYMQQGQKNMAGRLGIDAKGAMNKEQAQLLATSQIAGFAVKKGSGYLGNEVLTKVSTYADQYGEKEPPKLQEGGIVSAPKTGMLAELHGNELVAPLDPNSLVAKLLVAPFSEIQKEMQKTMDVSKTESPAPAAGSPEETMTAMIDMLATKLDTVIDKLSDGNDTQDKLLKYSMV